MTGRRTLLALALLAASACRQQRDPLPGLPRIFLWAWEHPEQLTFLDPQRVGVAFLARTVRWQNGIVTSTPRRQPLDMPPSTRVIAVVRLEGSGTPMPDAGMIAAEIGKAAALPGLSALQIDFDARRSERSWYAEVLRRVRGKTAPTLPLTMTALASWCLGDAWIGGLPVADAIPMMFRMGRAEPHVVREYSLGLCRSSVGIATDEVAPAVPHGRRIFLFHPGSWTAESYRGAMQIARRLE